MHVSIPHHNEIKLGDIWRNHADHGFWVLVLNLDPGIVKYDGYTWCDEMVEVLYFFPDGESRILRFTQADIKHFWFLVSRIE